MVGYDANANDNLDYSEASPLFVFPAPITNAPRYATIKGINKAQYDAARDATHGLIDKWWDPEPVDGPGLYCRSLLSVFYYTDFRSAHPAVASTSSIAVRSWNAFTNNTQFSEWLSHNCGTDFDYNGQATLTKEYTWDAQSTASQFFATKATPFRMEETVCRGYPPVLVTVQTATCWTIRQYYENHVRPQAIAALSPESVPVGQTWPSPFVSFPNQYSDLLTGTNGPGMPPPAPWVAPRTLIIGDPGVYTGIWGQIEAASDGGQGVDDYDAAGAIGRGRAVDPRYSFTVRKVDTSGTYHVDSVRFVCVLQDLYDFNLEDIEIASNAAAVQIAYGCGSSSSSRANGVIFFDTIQIDYTYSAPFDVAE